MSFEYAAYLALILAGAWAVQKTFGVQLPARRLMLTLLAVAAVFVAWDAWAVWRGHWSFNPEFVMGVFIGNQPIEEIAFFFVVPFFYIVAWEAAKKRAQTDDQKRKNKTKPGTHAKNEASASERPRAANQPEKGGRSG